MQKKSKRNAALAEIAARDAMLSVMMRDWLARQAATEHVVQMIATIILAALPDEQRRGFLNDLYAERAEESLKLQDAGRTGVADADAKLFEMQTQDHLAKIISRMAERMATLAAAGPLKN
jgi:hypothetical protein